VHHGFGFTGNGVGPSHLGGEILEEHVGRERLIHLVPRHDAPDPPPRAQHQRVGLAHHVDEERLPARNIERIDNAEQRCQHKHRPYAPFLYPTRQREHREHQGENHRCNLSCNDNSLPIESDWAFYVLQNAPCSVLLASHPVVPKEVNV
jgi:hypothetical protein